jgi:hypothetical protein
MGDDMVRHIWERLRGLWVGLPVLGACLVAVAVGNTIGPLAGVGAGIAIGLLAALVIEAPLRALATVAAKIAEEIDLMRLTYGRKFIQVSVYASEAERRETIVQKIKAYDNIPRTDALCERQAIELIEMDYNQAEVEAGQRVAEVFHLGDAFIPGIGAHKITNTVSRFVNALFGDNGCSPTRVEYGMFMAAATKSPKRLVAHIGERAPGRRSATMKSASTRTSGADNKYYTTLLLEWVWRIF